MPSQPKSRETIPDHIFRSGQKHVKKYLLRCDSNPLPQDYGANALPTEPLQGLRTVCDMRLQPMKMLHCRLILKPHSSQLSPTNRPALGYTHILFIGQCVILSQVQLQIFCRSNCSFVIGYIGKLFCHGSICSLVAGHSGKLFHALAVIGHANILMIYQRVQMNHLGPYGCYAANQRKPLMAA